MSTFRCEVCGALCIDTRYGCVTGCEHHPPDCQCEGRLTQCVPCAFQDRLAAGEAVEDLLRDYGLREAR